MRRRAFRGQRRIAAVDIGGDKADLAARVVGQRGQKPGSRSALRQIAAEKQQPPAGRDPLQDGAAERGNLEHRDRGQRQRHGIADVSERHGGQPPTIAAARPIASTSGSGIHSPSTSSSPAATATIGTAELAVRGRCDAGRADRRRPCRSSDATQRRTRRRWRRGTTPATTQALGADGGPQQLVFAHENRERRHPDQRQQADQQRQRPTAGRRATHRRCGACRGCRSAARDARPRRTPAICRREWFSVWNSAAKAPSGPSP